MERIKLIADIGVTVFGLLAAIFAILSLVYGSKLNYVKKVEEERLKSRIAESNAFAEKAKEEAAHALSSTANTNERAIKLELQVETQKERAATAEKELLILKDKIKPRHIPPGKVKDLVNELEKFKFKEINISSSLGDGEAAQYANQFKSLFESAGWQGCSILSNLWITKDFCPLKGVFIKFAFNIEDIVFSKNVHSGTSECR